MRIKMTKSSLSFLVSFLVYLIMICSSNSSSANIRFISNYPCSDAVKTCVSSGARKVDGFDVYKECWEYSYAKTCAYPSRNDCRLYEHCYSVADLECLLKDSLGNCVNRKREFSCKSWEVISKENKEAKIGLEAKDGPSRMVCQGVPCIDGNCVDKSYFTNGEMMDSISKLHTASQIKPDKKHNFNLFAGFDARCSKKALSYSNCCPDTHKGWGKHLGASCTKDEIDLIDKREKKLCVYVGKTSNKTIGVTTVVKHHYCCFTNILEKVVQVEGRKQLGINFGSGANPNCRGLTLDEIKKLDFNKIDFSEFIDEITLKFAGTYKKPNPKAISDNINNHLNIRKYDGNENNQANKLTGVSAHIKDDSWETQEEERLSLEQKSKAEQARKEQESKQDRCRCIGCILDRPSWCEKKRL